MILKASKNVEPKNHLVKTALEELKMQLFSVVLLKALVTLDACLKKKLEIYGVLVILLDKFLTVQIAWLVICVQRESPY